MSELKEKFIQEYATTFLEYDHFVELYGKSLVDEWLGDAETRTKIKAITAVNRKQKAEDKTLMTKEYLMLRGKSFDNLVAILNDKTHKDHAKISLTFTSAERAYLDAYFKAKGEIDAQSGEKPNATILELVYANKKAD